MPLTTWLRNASTAALLTGAIAATLACGGGDDAAPKASPAATSAPGVTPAASATRPPNATPASGATAAPNATPASGPTSTPSGEVRVDDKQDGQEVRLARGAKLIVSLEANHTTGFRWVVQDGATPVLAAAYDNRYDSPDTGLIGRGGTEVFTFTAASAGTATLRLAYLGPGTSPAPGRTYTLRVRVE